MKAAQLRASLLLMAVSGQLVPQIESEGGAADFLKKIDSTTVTHTGKKHQKDIVPEISETEIPFEIPNTWVWCRLSDVANFTLGKTPERKVKEYWDGGIYPWVAIGDIPNNGLITKTSESITKKAMDKCFKEGSSKAGTLIMSFKLSIGKTAILGIDAVHNEAIISIYPKYDVNNIFRDYLKLVLPLSAKNGDSRGAVKGETLNKNSLSHLLIPIPPLAEQTRIVTKFEKLLSLVDKYEIEEQKLSTLEKSLPKKIRKSILSDAISGKLVPQLAEEGTAADLLKEIAAERAALVAAGKMKKEKPFPAISEEEKPFEIPESWEWVRLRELVYNRGQKIPDKKFSYIDIGSIDNIHQRLNSDEKIIEAKDAPSRARKNVGDGDIIYATVRPYLHNTCIIDKKFSEEPIASTGFAVLTCYKGVFNKYLLSYLISPEFDNYANATENAKGMAYPAINDEKFYKATIPLPPLAEQKRIVAKVDELMKIIDEM